LFRHSEQAVLPGGQSELIAAADFRHLRYRFCGAPLGGLVFGLYADARPQEVLVVMISLMAVGTGLLGFPGFDWLHRHRGAAAVAAGALD
jgi:hypothetical protein